MQDQTRQQIVELLPRLRAFARSLAGNFDDADDLVQQTIEKGLANLSSFTPGTRLDSWLFRIMRNAWIDHYRAMRPVVAIDDADVVPPLVGEDGRRVIEARSELERVRAAMKDLTHDQRAVLILVCVEGMQYREVSEALDIPIGTVMSRLARARLALGEKMAAMQDPARIKGAAR